VFDYLNGLADKVETLVLAFAFVGWLASSALATWGKEGSYKRGGITFVVGAIIMACLYQAQFFVDLGKKDITTGGGGTPTQQPAGGEAPAGGAPGD